MSRYVIPIDKSKDFVYGFDHAIGFFYQIWDYTRGKEDEDQLIEDRSYILDGLTKEEMLHFIKKYKADPRHIDLFVLDLPF